MPDLRLLTPRGVVPFTRREHARASLRTGLRRAEAASTSQRIRRCTQMADVVVTKDGGSGVGAGMILGILVVVLAIVFAIWYFGLGGAGTGDGDTDINVNLPSINVQNPASS